MKNNNIPANTEIPSTGKLIKSTVLAIIAAAIILVTVVLPAEYGIDPTGVGSFIGLSKMGEIKVSLAQEAATDRISQDAQRTTGADNQKPVSDSDAATSKSDTPARSDKMTISLSPGEGKEIKLTMKKGEQVNYEWWTSGGKANFDAHADSEKLQIDYHSYSKGSLERNEGALEAAFDGNHGWFWRNRTSKPMTVTLQVNGKYSAIKRIE